MIAKTRKFSISVIFSILTGAFLISVTNSNVAAPTFVLEKNGRDFDKISIHPNSEDWLFTECSRDLDPHGDCHLLRYNINTKQLQRYLLPDGYLYGYASFSPRGNFIVMNRSPKHDGSEAGIRQSRENGEIVMMRSDGADFRVLPIPKGRNIAPVMSKDETRIAYWRNSDVPQPSGRTAGFGDFDIREYDLRTHKDSLFAGPFHFYEGGNSQYLSDDEIMINSYGPRQHSQSMSDYQKRFNRSQVYVLKRGATNLPEPCFTDIESAKNSSVDVSGNIYLDGQKMPTVGSAFFRRTRSGETTLWQRPHLGALRHVVAAPDGQYIAFIYVAEGTRYPDRKSAFGLLDTIHGAWLPIAIPPLQSSTPLVVETVAE